MTTEAAPHLPVELAAPPATRAPGTRALAALARQMAACPALWEPHVAHDPSHRVHLRLAALPSWEAWLITWPPGQSVEVHDHGGSAGAVAVLEGELTEVVASAWWRGGRRVARRTLPAGTVHRVGPRRIHDVLNVAAVPAVSLHLYGPALSSMTFYDDELRPTRTEVTFPEPPLLAPGSVVIGLAHGARRG